jgi:hypothetical protein
MKERPIVHPHHVGGATGFELEGGQVKSSRQGLFDRYKDGFIHAIDDSMKHDSHHLIFTVMAHPEDLLPPT